MLQHVHLPVVVAGDYPGGPGLAVGVADGGVLGQAEAQGDGAVSAGIRWARGGHGAGEGLAEVSCLAGVHELGVQVLAQLVDAPFKILRWWVELSERGDVASRIDPIVLRM